MAAGPTKTTKMPGKDEQDQGEKEFDGGFGGLFLGQLPPSRPHRVALDAQGMGDAGAELVGLDEDGGQGAEVGDAGPYPQFVEGLRPRTPHLQMEVRQRQLFGQDADGFASSRR